MNAMPWEVAIKLHPELQKCLAALAKLGPWGTTPGEAAGMILARAHRRAPPSSP